MITKNSIIKLIDLESVVKQTDWINSMEIVGSRNYMSPNQFEGNPLDFCSYIYNIGVMFYEMLSDKLPYKVNTICRHSIAQKHMTKEFIPLIDILPARNKSIWILVNRMLRKEKNRKF